MLNDPIFLHIFPTDNTLNDPIWTHFLMCLKISKLNPHIWTFIRTVNLNTAYHSSSQLWLLSLELRMFTVRTLIEFFVDLIHTLLAENMGATDRLKSIICELKAHCANQVLINFLLFSILFSVLSCMHLGHLSGKGFFRVYWIDVTSLIRFFDYSALPPYLWFFNDTISRKMVAVAISTIPANMLRMILCATLHLAYQKSMALALTFLVLNIRMTYAFIHARWLTSHNFYTLLITLYYLG